MMSISGFSASQLIKLAIIMQAIKWKQLDDLHISVDEIDESFAKFKEDGSLDDCDNEVRCSGVETGIDCNQSSRHYETESVAIEVLGSWVGFTYWSGGGKYGEPELVPWIEDAYFVSAKPKIVTAYDFEKS